MSSKPASGPRDSAECPPFSNALNQLAAATSEASVSEVARDWLADKEAPKLAGVLGKWVNKSGQPLSPPSECLPPLG